MFTLWYAALTYKEYKDVIWEKLMPKKQTPTPKETAVVCPLPPKRSEPTKPTLVEPPKPPRTPSPQSPPSTPEYPLTPQATSTPINRSLDSPRPLEPPAKPPRSPSPHPIKAESIDDIEYEDEEEDEDDEEGSDVEEDEENSVISTSPRRNPLSNTVNEFINQEIQPNTLRLNQTR